jgi:phosphorylase/glycogen(starch) synthase
MKKNIKPKSDMLFEISWEVCNKAGGIFTVLSSKAAQMQKYYKDGYYLVGPYFPEASKTAFKEGSIPENYKKVYEDLKKEGIVCRFGTWLIKGEPKVILLDCKDFWSEMDIIKKELWDEFKLDSLDAPYDFNEPVLWSWAVGILLEKLSKIHGDKKIVAQAHEWLSGATVLYLKKNKVDVSTVFTTHATTLGRSLGRSLAGNGVELYSVLDKIDSRKEAYQYRVQAKHFMEKISAETADVFTTVSQTTALETKYILDKDVDVVLPNGYFRQRC